MPEMVEGSKTVEEPQVETKIENKYKIITKEELEKHNTVQDCWVAIHGYVIHVDEALQNEHPGGPEVVTAHAGKDCTEDFEDIGHSDTARAWSDKQCVGILEGTPESKIKFQRVPRNSDLAGGSEGGESGGIGLLPIIAGVIIAAAAYFLYMN